MIFKKLLSRSKAATNGKHFVPEGKRVYAIGDIHGRLDLLDRLLESIQADDGERAPADTLLIFLGDLVDRGPDSRGVVERLMQLRDGPLRARFLRGNHEEVLLKAAAGDARATRFMLRIGGTETVLSYGIDEDRFRALDYEQLTEALTAAIPQEHIDFLSSFESSIVVGDYLFVHAGIRPGVEIEAQSERDLCWIRDDFLDHRDPHDKMVVHGHSISPDIDARSNRIGIDTGAYASGRLTALGLENNARWFIST